MELAKRQTKLEALTGLRYLAAMTVVFSHVAIGNAEMAATILPSLSAIGMPLFFTLSGFLMCYNYYTDFASWRPGALWRFYVARIARIFPGYLAVLLLSFSFMGNFFHDLENHTKETRRCLRYCCTLTQSWVHKPVFESDLHPRTVTQSYLGVAWSVSTEVFFYATFPLVIPVLKRLTRPKSIVLTAAGIFLAYAAFDLWMCGGDSPHKLFGGYSREWWLLYLSPYGRIGEFWIGCLVGRLHGVTAARTAGPWETRFANALAWSCLPALYLFAKLVGTTPIVDQLHVNVGLAPICGVLIYCLARYRSLLQRLLGNRLFVLLGESSYCLFLLHPLVQSFFAQRTSGEADLNGWFVVTYNHVMMFAVMQMLALGFYQYFELPVRTRIRALLSPAATRPVILSFPEFAVLKSRAA
jgi:peptidoglycan/LPS O-acetylase OafA/YrhL